MKKDYQFTKEEAQRKSLDGKILDFGAPLCMSGDNWGETVIASFDDWENEIPKSDEKARDTGWYDFYTSSDYYDQDGTWEEYREELLSQLRDIEIVEEE